METIAWNRTPLPGEPLVALDELLARADVITLHLALNDATRGFLGPAQIARTKPGVILVNTARAALVDEAALIDGLRSGRIRHAGLDVFHAEPLKPADPLAGLDNVTLSAHAGVPDARSLDDAAAAGDRHRARDLRSAGRLTTGRPVASAAGQCYLGGRKEAGFCIVERSLDIAMQVNGEDVRMRVEARKTLVDFLRDDLGLTGSHVGCEQGVCGACTVLLDGAVVRGCLVLAVQCDGARVTPSRAFPIPGRSPICRMRSSGAMRCNAASVRPAC